MQSRIFSSFRDVGQLNIMNKEMGVFLHFTYENTIILVNFAKSVEGGHFLKYLMDIIMVYCKPIATLKIK